MHYVSATSTSSYSMASDDSFDAPLVLLMVGERRDAGDGWNRGASFILPTSDRRCQATSSSYASSASVLAKQRLLCSGDAPEYVDATDSESTERATDAGESFNDGKCAGLDRGGSPRAGEGGVVARRARRMLAGSSVKVGSMSTS